MIVPENTTGSPTVNPVLSLTVILSVDAVVAVAVCVTVIGVQANDNVIGTYAWLFDCDSKFWTVLENT